MKSHAPRLTAFLTCRWLVFGGLLAVLNCGCNEELEASDAGSLDVEMLSGAADSRLSDIRQLDSTPEASHIDSRPQDVRPMDFGVVVDSGPDVSIDDAERDSALDSTVPRDAAADRSLPDVPPDAAADAARLDTSNADALRPDREIDSALPVDAVVDATAPDTTLDAAALDAAEVDASPPDAGSDVTARDAAVIDAMQPDTARDAAVLDVAAPDAVVLDFEVPDTSLDIAVPDAAVPDAAVPDAAVPDAAVPDAAVPDAAVPDAAVPDAAFPDAAVPDAAVPDAAVPDAAVPDAEVPDAAVPDAAVPDAAVPDAAVPDAAVPDAAVPDAAVPDAAVPDAAVPDAAVPDVAVPDAAVPDAAVPDAAVPDAAVPDAAVPDAAVPDAGLPDCVRVAVLADRVEPPAELRWTTLDDALLVAWLDADAQQVNYVLADAAGDVAHTGSFASSGARLRVGIFDGEFVAAIDGAPVTARRFLMDGAVSPAVELGGGELLHVGPLGVLVREGRCQGAWYHPISGARTLEVVSCPGVDSRLVTDDGVLSVRGSDDPAGVSVSGDGWRVFGEFDGWFVPPEAASGPRGTVVATAPGAPVFSVDAESTWRLDGVLFGTVAVDVDRAMVGEAPFAIGPDGELVPLPRVPPSVLPPRGGIPITTAAGVGLLGVHEGQVVLEWLPVEVCNDADDDCDGEVDEPPPVRCRVDGGCASDGVSCVAGRLECPPAPAEVVACGPPFECVGRVGYVACGPNGAGDQIVDCEDGFLAPGPCVDADVCQNGHEQAADCAEGSTGLDVCVEGQWVAPGMCCVMRPPWVRPGLPWRIEDRELSVSYPGHDGCGINRQVRDACGRVVEHREVRGREGECVEVSRTTRWTYGEFGLVSHSASFDRFDPFNEDVEGLTVRHTYDGGHVVRADYDYFEQFGLFYDVQLLYAHDDAGRPVEERVLSEGLLVARSVFEYAELPPGVVAIERIDEDLDGEFDRETLHEVWISLPIP